MKSYGSASLNLSRSEGQSAVLLCRRRTHELAPAIFDFAQLADYSGLLPFVFLFANLLGFQF